MGGVIPSIIGGIVSSNASSKAAKAQTAAAAENRAFAQGMYDKGVAMVQPTVDRANGANTYVDGLLGIGGDPAAASKAWGAFRDSTGYQQQLMEGQNAIYGNNAARGTFQSGATAKALAEYSGGLADRSAQQYLGNLMNVSSQGQAAQAAILGQGTQLTNYVTGSITDAANAKASNALNQGKIFNGTMDNVGKALSSSFGF
ncbi:MAG: hypothetical protein EOO77_27040 [Oxalobacteraceae bacterium]|nr:MAG: hypothetical protein EOO77_27040 [Oxalobacteraceae bacterium]